MPTATFVTTKGSFTVSLMPEHAPKTVENFVGLAAGSKPWTDPRDGSAQTGALYPGDDLSQSDPWVHDPGWRPDGNRKRRARLHIRRRVSSRRAHVQPSRSARDGQRRTRHERLPVLRDGRRDAVAQRQAHDLRTSHRWLRSRRIDRGPHNGRQRPSGRRCRDRTDRYRRLNPIKLARSSTGCAPCRHARHRARAGTRARGRPTSSARSRAG